MPTDGRVTHDAIVVGSGFGGSVAALRLAERGHDVLLLEKGRRFAPHDFARTNWHLHRWLWAPRAGLRGPFQMRFLRHLTSLSGVGVGGGSLVYANTLEQPPAGAFDDPVWRATGDWATRLAPHYDEARRMLGAESWPPTTRADSLLQHAASAVDPQAERRAVRVGVHVGEPGVTVPDPYFGGLGPARTGCVACAACMLGCRHGAKNTLDLNYLHLAERVGVDLRPLHEVVAVGARPYGFEVVALEGSPRLGRPRARRIFRCRRLVLAAGVLGTLELLLDARARTDGLPKLSPTLGQGVRTNAELLLGVVGRGGRPPVAEGLSITSLVRLSDGSTLEPVRFPAGSGALRLLMAPHGEGMSATARLASALGRAGRRPAAFLRTLAARDHGRDTLILLRMGVAEDALTLRRGRGGRLVSTGRRGRAPDRGEAVRVADRLAEDMDGFVVSLATEAVLGRPTTAHILGGCAIARQASEGVVDPDLRAFGHPDLQIVDGSVLPGNPGVNPALTITALAESAMALG